MFIETENTPNPNALKFLPNVVFEIKQPVHFSNKEEAVSCPLALKIFNLKEVEAVFLGNNFITVTKSAENSWEGLKTEILLLIMEYLESGTPIIDYDAIITTKQNGNLDINPNEIEAQIIEIIETRVRPSVAMDGGDIIYKGFENGIVMLELRGACAGCPSSKITLKNGIEQMLKHFIPEVIAVEEFVW